MGKRKISEREKRERNLKRIQQFCLMDNSLMTKVFEGSKECTELILRIILEKDDLQVTDVHTEYTIKNLQGRSARLDIHGSDSRNKIYNVEIQREDDGATPKRARFHGSIMDANALLEGDEWEKLPETYVIFITENDVLGENKPIYHIDRTIEETREKFGDCLHIIYVNGAYKDDSPLGLLIQDFKCIDPGQMHYKALADRVRYFKENEEGIKKMTGVEAEWKAEVREETIEELKEELREGLKEELREGLKEELQENFVIEMLKEGELSKEKIAKYTGFSMEDIEEIEGKIMESAKGEILK